MSLPKFTFIKAGMMAEDGFWSDTTHANVTDSIDLDVNAMADEEKKSFDAVFEYIKAHAPPEWTSQQLAPSERLFTEEHEQPEIEVINENDDSVVMQWRGNVSVKHALTNDFMKPFLNKMYEHRKDPMTLQVTVWGTQEQQQEYWKYRMWFELGWGTITCSKGKKRKRDVPEVKWYQQGARTTL